MAERREGEEQADRRESYAELRCEVRWAKTGLEEEADCYPGLRTVCCPRTLPVR